MPSLRAVALVALVMDTALLGGFLYVSFLPNPLALASRLKILRRILGLSAVALLALFFKFPIDLILQLILIANALLLAGAVLLLFRKIAANARKSDPFWLRGYVQKLEAELADRLRIERDLAFIAAVTERDPNCVIEMDRDGSLGYRNPATEQTFPDLAAKGKSHPVVAGLQDALTILQGSGKTSLRRPFRCGERVYEQQITWSAETHKLCLYMTDVTEWKRRDQLKTELLNTVSHEFRTPLSSILATSAMIRSATLGPVTEEQEKMLSMLSGSATRLNRMIGDLLDLSKIEAGKFGLRWEEVELAELVDNVALSFIPLAKANGIELTTDIGPRPIYCLADADKIVQVLTNLTNNALKFTRAGRITLSAHATPTEVRCSVQDTGIGIPPDQIHRVFGQFQQFSSAIRGEKGTGLGLSLCKSLVELHQGTISVDSVPGQGTTFAFALPRRTAQSVFDKALQSLYEEAASAGRCLSAFILEVAEAPGAAAFAGKLRLAADLEAMVRRRVHSERDMILREQSRVYFILDSVNKIQAKAVADQLVGELIPLADAAGALGRTVVRAQFISLPDDGTILEGLQARLAA